MELSPVKSRDQIPGTRTSIASPSRLLSMDMRDVSAWDPPASQDQVQQGRESDDPTNTTQLARIRNDLKRLAALLTSKPGLPLLETKVLDVNPVLPITGNVPRLRDLLQTYIRWTYDRDTHVLAVKPGLKSSLLEHVYSDKAYCMALVTYVHAKQMMPRGFLQDTVDSVEFHQQALNVFQEVLNSSIGPSFIQSEWAIAVLCMLIHNEIAFERFSNIGFHWSGMITIVNAKGGLDCIKAFPYYVLYYEADCAIALGQPSYFNDTLTKDTKASYPIKGIYGSGLEEMKKTPQVFYSQVIEFAEETASFLELWETHRPLDRLETTAGVGFVPSIEYMFEERIRLHRSFAFLQSMLIRRPSVSKCILWTCRIVEMPVTWEDFLPALTTILCNELCSTLRLLRDRVFEVWSPSLDILSWILFTLATVEVDFIGRPWVIRTLRKLMIIQNPRGLVDEETREEQRLVLNKFVWVNSALEERYNHVCDELFAHR